MWDFIIKKELNKTIIGINQKSIPRKTAQNKLNDLMRLTKNNVVKGRKRQLKNNIFSVKKQFKL